MKIHWTETAEEHLDAIYAHIAQDSKTYAWAQTILTCPMLARGASIADIPDPIRDINPLSLEDERDCQQFLDDLEDATTLKRQARVEGDVAERIRGLVEAAQRKLGGSGLTSH